MKNILYLLIIFLSAFNVNAQTGSQLEQDYLYAKTLFQEGKYGLAESQFKAIADSTKYPFAPFAEFYAALCAANQGYNTIARDAFKNIPDKYPKWEKNDEAYHWLSYILFEEKNPFQALFYADKIKSVEIQKENHKIQRLFLSKINSLDSLNDLYNVYPNSNQVALRLAEKITTQPFSNRDFNLLNELIEEFPEVKESYGASIIQNEFKETYQVSLLLPLILDQTPINTRSKVNEFVLSYYRGLSMATDSLNGERQLIDLRIFDTQRDTSVVKNLLNDPEIANSDMIIGPVFNPELIFNFSYQAQVNTINPLSKNTDYIGNNPFYFLSTSSYENIGNTLAHAANQDSLKSGLILYANNSRDSMIAHVFYDSISKSDSLTLKLMEVTSSDSRKILNLLTGGSNINRMRGERSGSADFDFIFVSASQNAELLYSDVITASEIRSDNILVLGTHNWMNDGNMDHTKFNNLNIVMADIDYIDYLSEAYISFSKKYLSKYGKVPDRFATTGYNTLMTYAYMMENHGKYFQLESQQSPIKYLTPFSSYFILENENYNSFVPIIRWNGEKTVVINEYNVLAEDEQK